MIRMKRLVIGLVTAAVLSTAVYAQLRKEAAAASNVSATVAGAIAVDLAKQPDDVKAAQQLLEARSVAWQRLIQSILSQPSVQAEQQALQQAEADRNAKVLKASGKDPANWMVEATQAGLRIVPKPKENAPK